LGKEDVKELQDVGIVPGSRPVVRRSAIVSSDWQPQLLILDSATTTNAAGALNLSGDTAGWVIEAAKKLESLGRFRKDWDSYGGLPLKRGANHLTLNVLRWLRTDELPVPSVVLGSGGTVQLEWRAKGKELEIELRDNDTIEFVKIFPSGDIEEGEAASDLSGKLRDLTLWFRRS
jgi:hypothetical protein